MTATPEFELLLASDPELDEIDELDESHFFPVSLEHLGLQTAREFDLYVKRESGFALYRRGDVPLTAADLASLDGKIDKTFYVLRSERDKFMLYMEESVMSEMIDDSVPLEKRADALYSLSAAVITELLADPASKRSVQRCRRLVDGVAKFAANAPAALRSLFTQDRMEPYLVTHSIDACVFGIGIGRRLGVDNPDDIRDLGLGCLLHDIGKRAIPESILSKPGNLSPQEWMVMKKHPELGLRMCEKAGGVPALTGVTIIQHHEMVDGSGYPKGLAGDDIHLFGRIIGGADIFDALTSDRPYARGRDSFPALKLIKSEFRDKLDPAVFTELVRMLGG